jgi:predicted DNA-binding transcriptional regulator AlpA
MSSYLLQIQDEENFFLKIRKIVKDELNHGAGNRQDPKKQDSPFIKVEEVMLLLKVSRPTINEWVDKGYFKKYKVNSRTFYNRDEILEFLSKQGK